MPTSLGLRFGPVLALLAGLVGGLPGRADDPTPNDLARRIDDIVHQYVHEDGPGLVVLVLKGGRPVHKKGYGLADVGNKVPITPQTTFELASVSKQFTAMAVMILHDRGRLSFDDDVRTFLPAVPAFDPKRPIRIRDLLNHTSGLPDYPYSLPTNAAVLAWVSRQKKLNAPTGTRFEYSNTGYVTLALVVAAAGKPFHRFLHEEVFKPLGMTSTLAFEAARLDRGSRAYGYVRRPKQEDFRDDDTPQAVFRKTQAKFFRKVEEDTLVVGDGSVWSNLDDLALWDAAVRERKLVRPET